MDRDIVSGFFLVLVEDLSDFGNRLVMASISRSQNDKDTYHNQARMNREIPIVFSSRFSRILVTSRQ